MTVAELKAELAKHDEHLEVFVCGKVEINPRPIEAVKVRTESGSKRKIIITAPL